MYLLYTLLLTSNKEKIKKSYLKVYNFLCNDSIEDVETFETINGEIEINNTFIERLINTIIDQNNNELYEQVISIYQ